MLDKRYTSLMASPLANEPLVISEIKITFLLLTDRFYSSLTWDDWVGKWEKLGEFYRPCGVV